MLTYFLCNGPEGKYFRLFRIHTLCSKCSLLLLSCDCSHRQYLTRRGWLWSKHTLFTKQAASLISPIGCSLPMPGLETLCVSEYFMVVYYNNMTRSFDLRRIIQCLRASVTHNYTRNYFLWLVFSSSHPQHYGPTELLFILLHPAQMSPLLWSLSPFWHTRWCVKHQVLDTYSKSQWATPSFILREYIFMSQLKHSCHCTLCVSLHPLNLSSAFEVSVSAEVPAI